ncbi:hypothetical protein Solca_2487 [Solitalea canadensis DSM 3403]|uniref:Uncharacterized protein n=1 Tax=Solitalea canadensis (strain ATCC 29591 / DSM 3403 / JCM 21819 / LMG 8368 / NBRC 15130 / NCIMB 12057 / USAM 9D) TaxID=929556 RepID=H8KUN9_SOLCM|nr:hypothetical protein Solca_2487 [Solitalea canadensis DSM 3403]
MKQLFNQILLLKKSKNKQNSLATVYLLTVSVPRFPQEGSVRFRNGHPNLDDFPTRPKKLPNIKNPDQFETEQGNTNINYNLLNYSSFVNQINDISTVSFCLLIR